MREVSGNVSAAAFLLYLYKRRRRERGEVGRHSSSRLLVDDVLCYLILTEKGKQENVDTGCWHVYISKHSAFDFLFIYSCVALWTD